MQGAGPDNQQRDSFNFETRPYPLSARAYARLGEADSAMKCLEQSYEERECLQVLLKAMEWWAPLRSDARFENLVRRIGIP